MPSAPVSSPCHASAPLRVNQAVRDVRDGDGLGDDLLLPDRQFRRLARLGLDSEAIEVAGCLGRLSPSAPAADGRAQAIAAAKTQVQSRPVVVETGRALMGGDSWKRPYWDGKPRPAGRRRASLAPMPRRDEGAGSSPDLNHRASPPRRRRRRTEIPRSLRGRPPSAPRKLPLRNSRYRRLLIRRPPAGRRAFQPEGYPCRNANVENSL
jgi:hypothetical protein